jgi:hypothetical protein
MRKASLKSFDFRLAFAQNRYKIATLDNLELVGPEGMEDTVIKLAKPSCEACHVFRFEQ